MVIPSEGNNSTVQVNWDDNMDKHWLDEYNPNSIMMALMKCLDACPRDVRKDVVSNLVFCGETLVLVPDLGRRLSQRLIALLNKSATSFDEEPVSELTVVPTEWSHLSPLSSCVAVTSTAPLRPDLVSWVGASLWATVWHRHDDESDAHAKWTLAPENPS
jgi:actin-related protein